MVGKVDNGKKWDQKVGSAISYPAQGAEFGLYPAIARSHQKSFKLGSNMTCSPFFKGHIGCCRGKGLEEDECGSGKTDEEAMAGVWAWDDGDSDRVVAMHMERNGWICGRICRMTSQDLLRHWMGGWGRFYSQHLSSYVLVFGHHNDYK